MKDLPATNSEGALLVISNKIEDNQETQRQAFLLKTIKLNMIMLVNTEGKTRFLKILNIEDRVV